MQNKEEIINVIKMWMVFVGVLLVAATIGLIGGIVEGILRIIK